MRGSLSLCLLVVACSQNRGMGTTTGGSTTGGSTTGGTTTGGQYDFSIPPNTDLALTPAEMCLNDPTQCYTVYAHGDHILYKVDLLAKTLVTVGPFKAPMVNGNEDIITDLAVSPTDVIYVTSKTQLYTASSTDGHVTL